MCSHGSDGVRHTEYVQSWFIALPLTREPLTVPSVGFPPRDLRVALLDISP